MPIVGRRYQTRRINVRAAIADVIMAPRGALRIAPTQLREAAGNSIANQATVTLTMRRPRFGPSALLVSTRRPYRLIVPKFSWML